MGTRDPRNQAGLTGPSLIHFHLDQCFGEIINDLFSSEPHHVCAPKET